MSADYSYWRSLEERSRRADGVPPPPSHDEFPDGAVDPPDGPTRRTVLALLGASGALASLLACRRPEQHIVPYVDAPEDVVPGVPRRFATTLASGLSACGVVVESHEGRPTKIEGNELHPASGGGTSAQLQAELLALYDPDRSRSVLHNGEPKSFAEFVAAWRALADEHAKDGGARLAFVTPSFASPTLARLAGALRGRFPRARWAAHEAASDENALAGIALATGRPLQPLYHLERADIVLALDADLFDGGVESVRHMAGFAAGRRRGTAGEAMSRLYAVESALTLTGAMADHRLRLAPSEVAGFLSALGAALGQAAPAARGPAGDPRFLEAVARDLAAHRGRGLVVAGPRQAPPVHAAALALNAALGNVGSTVTLHEPLDALLPDRAALAALTGALSAGAIDTLVLLGVNPVYDAPADLEFGTALQRAPNRIHLGTHVDETARACTWHLPRAHALEAWEDARAAGGTPSVVQPLIAPLHGGRSLTEVLALLATGEERPGYDLVRETWQAILGADAFETKWNRVLHDGLLADGGAPAVVPSIARVPVPAQQAPAGGIEVVFRPSPVVHDGRFANNGWLQELPDPVTKLTWHNPLLLSPATAAKLGLSNEDVVRAELRGRSAELPVWIVPGQADGVAVLTLGYGRRAAGRVGDGVGADVYALRTSAAPDHDAGLTLTRTGATLPLAVTQEHGSMEGRPIVREGTLADFRRDPSLAPHGHHALAGFSLFEEQAYEKGPQWGMAIDLNVCTGCSACVVACQAENNIPVVGPEQVRRSREMHWLRIDRYFSGPADDPQVVVQPVPCMHCENAPCEQVCPVAATVHDGEGLNAMVYNRCIGTRYCSNNCPYKVRHFNFFNYTKDTPETLRMAQNPNVTVRSRGVMEKCTYCVQRINAAKLDARLAGRAVADGDVRTACQQACPAQAISFGDLRDGGSRVVQHKREARNYALLAEMHTKPRTTYLARVRNPNPALAPAAEDHAPEPHS